MLSDSIQFFLSLSAFSFSFCWFSPKQDRRSFLFFYGWRWATTTSRREGEGEKDRPPRRELTETVLSLAKRYTKERKNKKKKRGDALAPFIISLKWTALQNQGVIIVIDHHYRDSTVRNCVPFCNGQWLAFLERFSLPLQDKLPPMWSMILFVRERQAKKKEIFFLLNMSASLFYYYWTQTKPSNFNDRVRNVCPLIIFSGYSPIEDTWKRTAMYTMLADNIWRTNLAANSEHS